MMQQTQTEKQAVARAVLPGATVTFHQDGTATLQEAFTMECRWCGALHDVEGEGVAFDPAEAWGLLQAVRRYLDVEAYRQAAQAVMTAIEGI